MSYFSRNIVEKKGEIEFFIWNFGKWNFKKKIHPFWKWNFWSLNVREINPTLYVFEKKDPWRGRGEWRVCSFIWTVYLLCSYLLEFTLKWSFYNTTYSIDYLYKRSNHVIAFWVSWIHTKKHICPPERKRMYFEKSL